MAWLILDPAIDSGAGEGADFDLIVTTNNDAIEGYSFTNAFGNPQTFPSTVVTDSNGNVVTTE